MFWTEEEKKCINKHWILEQSSVINAGLCSVGFCLQSREKEALIFKGSLEMREEGLSLSPKQVQGSFEL